MVTLRQSTRRAARGSSSAARGSTRSPSIQDSPVPVTFAANQSSSHVPISSREAFNFDGVQYSPYFLTSGDNPGTSLISEVLDGSNYNTWIIAITIALEAKNKIAFVDGSLPRPIETHPHYRIWSRCNSMVKSWILNSVTKQIYGSILRFQDASEIWKDLTVRFHIINLPRSYQLMQQIWSLQQGNTDLSTYYTKLKTLWDDLDGEDCVKTCQSCNCCKAMATKTEHSKIIKFLAGLNESYSNARSQIIMKKNVPNLGEVYNLLDQDYSQRSITPVQNATAFQMTAPDNAHPLINAAYNTQKQRPICSHCGYTGHTVDKCYKIHGYPPGFKHKVKQSEKSSHSDTQVKLVVAQLALQHSTVSEISVPEMINILSKDQI